ncbi:FMN-dependent NADH-azoreductase [Sphingobium fluviale]|uniref:FMN dependent NADH:quinone oxidoreductase n=1 Tax=Sphingobium fluviale TaxID=2506423 RepID=A0A4Q1KCY3_9SPHN|nr:NAD(P)H-dependent oxidoreductase [Sphingobium fluviale]RXR25167.1 FMN-dependent NADH-azoreductase [Sphingobium fluviale]
MRLLHVDSSITSGNSVSRQLTARLTRRYATEAFDVSVVYRDLARSPLHHLSPAYLQAQFAEPGQHSAPLEEDLSVSSEVLEEFLAADTVVVGAPMYNFTIPSQLKAWIDRLAVAGKTFRYTETGSVGLVEGKKLFIVSTRGGFYGPETACLMTLWSVRVRMRCPVRGGHPGPDGRGRIAKPLVVKGPG